MGTKRKATQAQLAPEPRRSRRNAEKCDVIEQINGGETKVASSKAIKSTAQVAATKAVKRAIIDEEIDFNKEIIPIRTYGKSDKITPTTVQNNEAKSRPNRLAAKLSSVQKTDILKPEKTIKKKGNLTINSPAKIEVRTTAGNVQPIQATYSTVEAGGQKKIIINKIIMPPDAYNQMMCKPTPNQSINKSPTFKTTVAGNSVPITTQVPVQQLINNLGPLVFSSGIKVIPNLTVTNPQQPTVLSTANVLPINQIAQVANQFNNKNANLRIVTTLPNQQMTNAPASGIKQLQLPIIIKSIVNPISTQQSVVSTQAKTTSAQVKPIDTQVKKISANLINKVNPISSVKAPNVNKTPERVVINVDTNKKDRTKKTRVSFNFDKNTSTNIRPITNELPVVASNVLMTSTPKQSIIKKPKVFELPCTPIVSNLATKRIVRTVTSAVRPSTSTTTVEPSTMAEQVKNKIEKVRNYSNSPSPISVKYCKQQACSCWSNLPKSDLDQVKQVIGSLNAPKRMLYVYCTTIKINEQAKFDFEKYVFYVRTQNGFMQVCHRVYMDIFEKQNLSFVETAYKKYH